MKRFLIVLLLLLPTVAAQLDWSVTDIRCGNGVLDDYELCEDGVEENFCDDLAELLTIDTGCDRAHCTCVPRVNTAFCGNNRREGVEICDGNGDDLCPEFGNITGIPLECDPNTCGCKFAETIPADYDPQTMEDLINASEADSVCGNKKIEGDEDCDPPNTLCTTSSDDPGICTDICKCVDPSAIDSEEEEINETVEINEPVESNITEEVIPENVTEAEEISENVSEEPKKEEKKGVFARFWAWIVSIFS